MKSREKFLKLALEAGVIKLFGSDVLFDKTFQGNASVLQEAAWACRRTMDHTLPLREAEVLMSFDHVTYGLPFVATAGLELYGGDAKCFVHYEAHARDVTSRLAGKKVVILALSEDDLVLAGVQAFVNQHGGQLLGTVALLSTRSNDEKQYDIPVARVLCHADITNHALASC